MGFGEICQAGIAVLGLSSLERAEEIRLKQKSKLH